MINRLFLLIIFFLPCEIRGQTRLSPAMLFAKRMLLRIGISTPVMVTTTTAATAATAVMVPGHDQASCQQERHQRSDHEGS